MTRMSYAIVMPARNEEQNLPRAAEWLSSQTVLPKEWIVVDNGSTDGTLEYARQLAQEHPWIRVIGCEGTPTPVRGAPVVRAFTAGLRALETPTDIVVKLDADVSANADYFGRLIDYFETDPKLGIAGGVCLELVSDEWVETRATIGHVRGASRAYRWACLQDVLPLEERMGWDGLDALKATTRGWRTATVPVPFRHHRPVGVRDAHETKRWLAAGEQAHYMNYRPSYVAFRSLRWSLTDWRALAMVCGFMRAFVLRRPQHDDRLVRALLRDRQRFRNLPSRAAEALGYAAASRRP
jgi:biofilm PGA synthesis N-glycosyltransferase PgaC